MPVSASHIAIPAALLVTLMVAQSQAQTTPAQPPATETAQPNQTSTAPAGQTADLSALEQRVARLEERTESALALTNQRMQTVNERSEISTRILYLASILGGFMILFFSIRDWYLRSSETQRQRSIDEIVKETMKLQKEATSMQLQFGKLQLSEAETGLRQQGEGLQKVNQVIEVVNRTLAFRLQQEEKFAKTIEEIERMKVEQHEKKKQKLAQAIAINDHFKRMSRMEYASLTDEQYRRGLRLQRLVNESEELLGEEHYLVVGSLLYDCGVIAYYDNDVVEAKAYLDRAAACRAPDHDAQIEANEGYRRRFSFVHFFRALIQKNWGDLAEARREIDLSMSYETREGEFLTPVTRAEILSYLPIDEEPCMKELSGLLSRMRAVEADLRNKGLELDANQQKLRNRMLMLSGNIHFIRKELGPALAQYEEAIRLHAGDYYALGSAGQCLSELGDAGRARVRFQECLAAIERSGDFRRKREHITRAVIAVTAVQAAKGSADPKAREQWARDARDLLSGNLNVDGLSPKFFSPATKRQASAEELLRQLDA